MVEEISRADGSTGWVAMLGSGVSEFAGWMDAETAAAMLDEVGPFDTAGSARLLTTAEAEAIVRSARAYLVSATREAWAVAQDPAREPSAALVDLRLSIVHAMHESVKAVDLLFHAAGTNAVYTKHRLERCFRDVHVGVQHAAALPVHYETAGRQLLGLEADVPGW